MRCRPFDQCLLNESGADQQLTAEAKPLQQPPTSTLTMTERIKDVKAEIRHLEQEQQLAELEARNHELRTRSAFTPSSNNGTPYLLPSQCRSSTGKITL